RRSMSHALMSTLVHKCAAFSFTVFDNISLSFFLLIPHLPTFSLFPYTTLFRSPTCKWYAGPTAATDSSLVTNDVGSERIGDPARSEEHTSELQSRFDLVCRLLLEKKK